MIGNNFHRVYISFGSNKGNRLDNIIISLKEIEVQLGRIEKISNLYLTKSWGFKSRDFYNGCFVLKTKYSLKIVLKTLLNIESSIGRVRKKSNVYLDREIDLDILFFDSVIIKSKGLTVPHPRINYRKFVLIPLCDINPNFIHPETKKSIFKILSASIEKESLKKIKQNNYYIPFWNKCSFISIEGNIGVGKTTLTKIFKSHFVINSLNESFKQNPYLERFYLNSKLFSSKLENFFLIERTKQIKSHFLNYKNKKTVSDYWIGKSLVFAKNNLTDILFSQFKSKYHSQVQQLRMPDLVIYLQQKTDELQKQIKKRGRFYEKNISKKYLDSISKEYENIFNQKQNFLLIVINSREVSELNSKKGQQKLFRKLFKFLYQNKNPRV